MDARFITQLAVLTILCMNAVINQSKKYESATYIQGWQVFDEQRFQTTVAIAQTKLFDQQVQLHKSHDRRCNSFLCILLLTLSADINPNPGPESSQSENSCGSSTLEETYFPCGACAREVTWDHRAVQCDECFNWYHIECHAINTARYDEMNESESGDDENQDKISKPKVPVWICNDCGNVNYSQYAFMSSIWGIGDLSDNHFHPLEDLDTSDVDVHKKIGLPLYTSSPTAKTATEPKTKPKHRRTLKIINLNCQSLRNKPELLQNLADSVKPDIIIGTESWLTRDIKDSEVFPEGYRQTAVRRDRQDLPRYKDTKGGGTFVLLKDDIIGVQQVTLETDCEITWVRFDITGSKSVYVAAYYRPREGDKPSIDELEKSLSQICNKTNSHIWIGGDFNFPGYDWEKDCIKPGCSQPELTRRFVNIMADNNLTQVVTEATFNQNTLDLFFVNNPSCVFSSHVIPGISADGHHAVFVECDITPIRNKQKPRQIKQYSKADWDGFRTYLASSSEAFLATHDIDTPVDDMWNDFTKIVEEGEKKFVPSKTARSKDRVPWITNSLKKQLRKQKKLFDKQKGCSKHTRAAQHYKSHKAFVQRLTRQAYWKYVNQLITPSDENTKGTATKKFFRFVKHKKQDAQGVAPLKNNGTLENDSKKKANILNAQFQSVFSKPSSLSPEQEQKLMQETENPTAPQMNPINITEKGVNKLLSGLNPNKAAGPDQLAPRVLKEVADELTGMVTLIFRASLKQKKAPGPWKTANVAPIFKKGEKYRPANYRPVSLTCILSKVMEHIVASQIMKHLAEHNLLNNNQHGFRSKLSTETQLIEFANDMLSGMKDGNQSDVVVMDFAKAFDKVSHEKLLYKLRMSGIDEDTCAWAGSFLCGRTQRVVVDGEASEEGEVTSGVPQGSVLGPIFFLIYINDMPEYTKHSSVRLFADDTIVYLTMTSEDDCEKLQEDLHALERWEKDWLMEFHPDKCSVMRVTRKKTVKKYPYTLHGQVLVDESETKYLGVTLTDNMSWNTHIEQTAAKANKKLGFVKRNLKVNNPEVKSLAYKTLVRPNLEYCSTVWDPHTQKSAQQLEMVQRRAARWVKNDYVQQSSVTQMLNELGWRTLAQRRADARLTLMYKIVHGLVLIEAIKYIKLQRDQLHLQQILAKQKYYEMSFFPRTVQDWNRLPKSVLAADSLEAFKSRVVGIEHHLPY